MLTLSCLFPYMLMLMLFEGVDIQKNLLLKVYICVLI